MNLDAFKMAERIASGIEPDAATLAWLSVGMRHWAERGGSLEAALGLIGAARTRICRRALCAAAELLRAGRDMSLFSLAGELEDRLRRFESGKLPQYRRGANVCMDGVELHLLEACQAGVRFPRSQRRLYDYLEAHFSG